MNTREQTDIESLLTGEPACEYKHLVTACEVHVTHRVIWCKGADLLCDTATGLIEEAILKDEKNCAGCHQHVADCWKVVAA